MTLKFVPNQSPTIVVPEFLIFLSSTSNLEIEFFFLLLVMPAFVFGPTPKKLAKPSNFILPFLKGRDSAATLSPRIYHFVSEVITC